jgi:ribonuclease E
VDIEAGKNGAGTINLRLCTAVALYILNHKRDYLQRMLVQRGLNVVILIDDSLGQGEHAVERTETNEDFVPPERPEAFIDLDDDFDDSAFADEDDDGEEFIADDDADEDREDSDDDGPRERAERVEGEGGRGRGRRRRGGRRDSAEGSTAETGAADAAPALAAGDDDDDSESGRRRRRGRRGGRRVREEGGERDGFTWVRGRTPSLDDPYVWFDPINPDRAEAVGDGAAASTSRTTGDEGVGERPDGETGGERGPRSRRRRGRGRGRDRGAEQGLTPEAKVEARATNEGMPTDGSPDTPMAVVVEETIEVAPVTLAAEPKRRRVRRKVATGDTAAETIPDVTPDEAEPVAEPAVLDVTPEEAAAAIEALPEPMVAAVAEPKPAPQPEVDVAALIAEDPNQIVAPPEKPKRGWWRR